MALTIYFWLVQNSSSLTFYQYCPFIYKKSFSSFYFCIIIQMNLLSDAFEPILSARLFAEQQSRLQNFGLINQTKTIQKLNMIGYKLLTLFKKQRILLAAI